MEWNTPDLNSWPSKLVIRVGRKLRSNKVFTQEAIKKNEAIAAERRQRRAEKYGHIRKSGDANSLEQDVNELGERDYSVFSQASTLVDNRDNTEMLHRLAHHDSFDSLVDQVLIKEKLKDPYFDSSDPNGLELITTLTRIHDRQFAALPSDVWKNIASFLTPADIASLAISTKTLCEKFGLEPLAALNDPDNRHHRMAFLHRLDSTLPRHLLCFPCAKFHVRSTPGKESLKADYVSNPLFACPNKRTAFLPRLRLVHGRELPYSFVQLVLRAHRHTSMHGIRVESLSRRWNCKDSGWSHRTRYMVHDGRLLMRVVSQSFAHPAAEGTETKERHLLYDREEYIPYFSVCSHWRDGDLMRLCKCALSHIPAPPQSYVQQLKKAPKISKSLAHPCFIVRGCDDCRPARRCPECPTEYLIEVQMCEDKDDPVRRFKHAIVVTRWSDLGDGSSPYTSPEFAAIKGSDPGSAGEAYESFSHVGRRAVSGIFESRISGSIPGQRMMSLNPKNKKLGEEGHGWY